MIGINIHKSGNEIIADKNLQISNRKKLKPVISYNSV